jgi:hypothetical protein
MARNGRRWLTALVVLAALTPPRAALADDDCATGPYGKHQCPRSMYALRNYWAPNLWRLDAYCHPRGNIYPVNTTPELVPQFRIVPYPCPGVNPRARPYYPNLGTPLDAPPETAAPAFGTPY